MLRLSADENFNGEACLDSTRVPFSARPPSATAPLSAGRTIR